MKPKFFLYRPLVLGFTLISLTIALVSWDGKRSPGHYRQPDNDTTPQKKMDREKKIRNLDDVLDELNNADINIDAEKIRKEVMESLKNIDAEKIRLDVEKALKEVDMDKIRKEVDASMAKIDWDKMRKDVEESALKIDWDQIRKQVDESMARIDWDNIRKEINEAKNFKLDNLDIDMKHLDEELKNLGPEMEKARKEIDKAKADIREYKEFVDGLQNDGLINKNDEYSIRHKDGELLINGKKASEQTVNKYRHFLDKHPKFKIEKTADDFDIDMD